MKSYITLFCLIVFSPLLTFSQQNKALSNYSDKGTVGQNTSIIASKQYDHAVINGQVNEIRTPQVNVPNDPAPPQAYQSFIRPLSTSDNRQILGIDTVFNPWDTLLRPKSYMEYDKNDVFIFRTGTENNINYTRAFVPVNGAYYDEDLNMRWPAGYGVQIAVYDNITACKNDLLRYKSRFKLPCFIYVDIAKDPYCYYLILGRFVKEKPALKLRNQLWDEFPGCLVVKYNS